KKGNARSAYYLQLKKKLEDEFPGCLDICGEGTPQATGFFEVTVAGKLVHSKKVGLSVQSVCPSCLVLRLAGSWDLCLGSAPLPSFHHPQREVRGLRTVFHGEQVSEAGGPTHPS
uniref:Selenoprotein W n=1 Tax=Canis lupus familiaris TaxID=9615 RepID=A0A8I3ML60_CANLF